jgi:undecaprenyl-phosphate 4-deoxy-4-formamido-L-arabinose transferase
MERMIGTTNARDISSFRAFRTQMRDGFAGFQSPFVSIDVLLTWSTARTTAIEVRRDPRLAGKSNYGVWKLIVATVNVVTAFSTLPLRLATLLGFFMALLGTGILAFVVVNYFLYGSNPGFPFLASIIAIFSGAQLLALGIIGEYLGRIFLRSMGRPAYAVKDIAGERSAVSGSEA